MPVVGPGQLRGAVTGWARYASREANRRRIAATNAYAIAVRTAALRHARRATAGYAAAATGALVAVPLTSSWTEAGCGLLAVVFGVRSGSSAARARRIARSPLPLTSTLPAAIPAPPPLGSAAWAPLSRIESAATAIRRLARASGPASVLASAEGAAVTLADAARLHAARVAALEGARRSLAPPAAAPLTEQVRALLRELERGAEAAEDLVAAAAGCVSGGGTGHTPVTLEAMASALRSATDEARARAHGLRVAATIDEGRVP